MTIRLVTSLFLKTPIKTIIQKGNAHLGLGQFDEAKDCYESLREFGQNSFADHYLKKIVETQEKVRLLNYMLWLD